MKNYLIFLSGLIICSLLIWKGCFNSNSNSNNDTNLSTLGSLQVDTILNNEVLKLKDSLETFKLKNGQLVGELNLANGTLEQKNNFLSKLQDNNKKLQGQLLLSSQFDLKFKIDSSKLTSNNYDSNLDFALPPLEDDSTIYPTKWSINYVDSGLIIDVYGNQFNNKIYGDSINLQLKGLLGITKLSNNQLKAYFTSPSPMLQSLNLDSEIYTIKEPKKKRFSIGPNVGIGFNTSRKIQPYIGIGLQYNLFSF